MKIGVAVATENASPSAFVVWRGLAESMKKAALLGYDGVELALASKDEAPVEEIAYLCSKYGLEVAAISTGQVYAVDNLYLTDPDKTTWLQTIKRLIGLIDLASEFGHKVNLGRVRGSLGDTNMSAASENRFITAVRELADYACGKKVEILIEPVNRYEIDFINNLAQGVEILLKVDRTNVALMPDVFHMNIEDQTIVGELVKYKDYISYIHFADSNRLAPGQGHLHFREIVSGLEAIGYDGWVTIEILPKPDPDLAAKQAIGYLRQLIKG